MAPTEPSEQPSENPGFGADTSPAQPTDTASASASTATDSTPTDTPPPEEGPLVALPPGSSTDAVAQAVDSTLSAYFAAINEKRMSDAWQLYSSSLQTKVGGYDRWISGYGSTSDDNISVATISTSSDSVVAHVRFDSHQDPQDAPDSTSTCVHWRIVYVLAPSHSSRTGYIIDTVRGDVPKGDKPYEPCA
jgi:hypothetical protein